MCGYNETCLRFKIKVLACAAGSEMSLADMVLWSNWPFFGRRGAIDM